MEKEEAGSGISCDCGSATALIDGYIGKKQWNARADNFGADMGAKMITVSREGLQACQKYERSAREVVGLIVIE